MRSFEGAARVLGDLEEKLMEILWQHHPLSVRDVGTRLGRNKLAYTTVMTTLDRLHKKGLLARQKDGNAFVYEPAMDRAEYQRRIIEATLTPLLEHGSRAVLAAFVGVAAELDEGNLAHLEKLIAEHRSKR